MWVEIIFVLVYLDPFVISSLFFSLVHIDVTGVVTIFFSYCRFISSILPSLSIDHPLLHFYLHFFLHSHLPSFRRLFLSSPSTLSWRILVSSHLPWFFFFFNFRQHTRLNVPYDAYVTEYQDSIKCSSDFLCHSYQWGWQWVFCSYFWKYAHS